MRARPSIKTRWIRVGILALALSMAAAVAVDAHVKFTNGKWVYRPRSIDADGDRSKKKDPLNIIFKGHNREYSNDNVFNHIANHAGWGGTGPCDAKQRAVWNKRNNNNNTSDKDDYQLDNRSNALCWDDRWHLRGWDDQEHDLYTTDHGRRNQWSVVGVHHEKGPPHKVDMDWDAARRKFIDKMAGHCSWPKWMHRAGGEGWIGGGGDTFYNSGWIGRISLKHTPDC